MSFFGNLLTASPLKEPLSSSMVCLPHAVKRGRLKAVALGIQMTVGGDAAATSATSRSRAPSVAFLPNEKRASLSDAPFAVRAALVRANASRTRDIAKSPSNPQAEIFETLRLIRLTLSSSMSFRINSSKQNQLSIFLLTPRSCQASVFAFLASLGSVNHLQIHAAKRPHRR